MAWNVSDGAAKRFQIATYTGPRALASRVRAALRGCGYDIVPATTRGRFENGGWRPAVRLADERQLDKLPAADTDPDTPVILLTGTRPLRCDDPRVVGSVKRPARLAPLYNLLQKTLERTPRQVPRAPARLAARGIQQDKRWVAAVTCLSTHGCMLQTRRPLAVGEQLNLQFAIPAAVTRPVGLITTRARCVQVYPEGAGLAFVEPEGPARSVIDEFVTGRLAAL